MFLISSKGMLKSFIIKGFKNSANLKKSLFSVLVAFVVIILVNAISSTIFKRFDLTTEKRYTLNPATLKMLENLDDYVYFKVYLDGNLPTGLKRFRNQIREMLDEFGAHSRNVVYDIINPMQAPDPEGLMEILAQSGIQPTQVQRKAEDATSQQVVFPGAIVTYRNMEVPVNLLVSQGVMQHYEEVLNNSVQALEFNLASAVRELIEEKRKSIGFVEGQGELSNIQMASIAGNLSKFYDISRVDVDDNLEEILKFNTLVIAKPVNPFSEKQKFVLDQFIMHGGKVLWLIDPVFASMDSLRPPATQTIGMPNPVNLDDMLFRYGVRLNSILVKDLNSVAIPMITGMVGNNPNYSLVPWPFFPLLDAASEHEIVKNINLVAGHFASTIDTVQASEIKKIPLLKTSPYTRLINSPATISFDFLKEPLNKDLFNYGEKVVAYLMEGRFESVFRNRQNPGAQVPLNIEIRNKSLKTAMIVAADGDLIKNGVGARGEPLQLGFDPNTRTTYGNLDFIVNCLNYLTDDSGILQTRAKDYRIRLLDKEKANLGKTVIQLANNIIPIIAILVFGLVRVWWRKKRYGTKVR